MRKRWMLVAVWVLATGFAMAMASFAVSLAGNGVTDGALPILETDEVATPRIDDGTDEDGTGEPVDDSGEDATETERAGDDGAVTSTTAAPVAPTTTAATVAAAAPSPRTPSGGAPSAPSPSGGAPTTATPAPTAAPATTTTTATPSATRTIAATGGSVVVRCTGSTTSIVGASPAGGFTVEVRDPGPEEIEVRFRSDDHTSTVKASCQAGAIDPRVQESGHG